MAVLMSLEGDVDTRREIQSKTERERDGKREKKKREWKVKDGKIKSCHQEEKGGKKGEEIH